MVHTTSSRRILPSPPRRLRVISSVSKTWTTAEFVEGLSEPAWGPVADKLEQGYARQIRGLPRCRQTFLVLAA
jgi:hypothetical protein